MTDKRLKLVPAVARLDPRGQQRRIVRIKQQRQIKEWQRKVAEQK